MSGIFEMCCHYRQTLHRGSPIKPSRIQVTPQQKQDLDASLPVEPEAYEAFLSGRYSWNKRTAEGVHVAINISATLLCAIPALLERMRGWQNVMRSTVFTTQGFRRAQPYQKTRAAAEKALELDDRLAEAHTALAIVKFLNDGDWDGPQHEFQRAIDKTPTMLQHTNGTQSGSTIKGGFRKRKPNCQSVST